MARIAHLTTVHQPRDNRIFNKECKSLAGEGFDQWLICAQNGDSEDGGVSIAGVGERGGWFHRLFVSQFRAWRALNRVKPDLVHVHDPELIPMTWMWKKVHRKAAIYDSHEDLVAQMEDKKYIPKPLRPLASLYARLLMRWADRGFEGVVAATPHIRTLFRNANTVIVHNFPYLKDFPDVTTGNAIENRLVYVGMLSLGRQVQTMVESVRKVPGATLVVAGKPDPEVAHLLTDLPEGDAIDFRGLIPLDEVPGLISTASAGLVFMQPLKNNLDSLPTKLFEYMASGIPFVATNFASWQEMLGPYDCCLFADTSTPDDPAKAIAALLDDPDRSAEMGKRGRKAIEEVFHFEADVPQLVAVSQRAIEQAQKYRR